MPSLQASPGRRQIPLVTPQEHTHTTLVGGGYPNPYTDRCTPPRRHAGKTHADTPPGDKRQHLGVGTQTREPDTSTHTQARHLQIHSSARSPPPLRCHSPLHAATCARPARSARAGPITGCCWGAAPARGSRSLRRPMSPPPAGARPGCGRSSVPPPTPTLPQRDSGDPSEPGATLLPGPTGHQGARASPNPIVCKQTRQTAEAPVRPDGAPRVPGASFPPGWPNLGPLDESWGTGCGNVRRLPSLPVHPVTSSREPSRPDLSQAASGIGVHTHPGGMNTPEE